MEKYFGAWDHYDDVWKDYRAHELDAEDRFPNPSEILIAGYEVDGYEGSSFLLFERGGALFLDEGGHCSCDGLVFDGGKNVTWDYLRHRLATGKFSGLSEHGVETLKALVDRRAPPPPPVPVLVMVKDYDGRSWQVTKEAADAWVAGRTRAAEEFVEYLKGEMHRDRFMELANRMWAPPPPAA